MSSWESAGSDVWKNEELGISYAFPEGGGFFRVRVGEHADTMIAMRVNIYSTETGNWPKFVRRLPEAVRGRILSAFLELEDVIAAKSSQKLAQSPPEFEPEKRIVDLWKKGKAEEIIHEAADILVAGQELQKDVLIMAFISQALPRELWIPLMLTGPTREGKSFTATTMGEYLLGEYFLPYTSHSPLFMSYMTRDNPHFYFLHVLYIDDLTHDPERLSSVRTFSDRTSKNPTHGTVIDGQPVTINADPPPLLLTSTVEAPKDPTIRGRFLIISIDESKRQDSTVFERQSEEAALKKRVDRYSEQVELAADMMNHIRHMRPDIRNLLGEAFKGPRQKGKETFAFLDGLTKSYGLLRVYQRPTLGSCSLVTWEDVRSALDLWYRWEGEQDRPPGRILAFMDNFGRDEELTKKQAVERSGLTGVTVYQYLRDALHYGLLVRLDGKPPKYRLRGTDEVQLVDSTEEKVRQALESIREEPVRKLLLQLAEHQHVELTDEQSEKFLEQLLPPKEVVGKETIGW